MNRLKNKKGFTLIELLVVISIILILVGFIMPQIGGAKAKARHAKCMNNLRVIGSALIMYASDHSGQFPGDLSDLYPNYIGDADVFDCPSTSDKPTVAGDKVTSEDYVYAPNLSDEEDSGTAVAADKGMAHNNGTKRNVLFVTGTVKSLEASDITTGTENKDGQITLDALTNSVGGGSSS